MDFLKKNGKGILLCFLVAFPSWLLVRQVGALEVIGAPVIAIIAGMALAIAIRDKRTWAARSSKNHGPLSTYSPITSFKNSIILPAFICLLCFSHSLSLIPQFVK